MADADRQQPAPVVEPPAAAQPAALAVGGFGLASILDRTDGHAPSSVFEMLAATDVDRRADVVNSLQRTCGNRHVSGMVLRAAATSGRRHFAGPALQSRPLQRYEAGEHAQFGARAGETEGKTTINKVEMSYGEMIAMGDLFETPDEMRKAAEAELRALVELIRRQRDKGTASVSEDEWIKATNGRYTKLAGKNVAHFAGKSQDGDFDAGGDGNRRQWWTFHIQALRSAQANKMDEAMQNNAFADHFLTDAFSAGHMINKSAVMDRAKAALNASATLRTFEVQVARGILADPLGATLGNFEANPGALSRWTAMTEQSLADVIDRIRYWKGDYFYSTFVKAVHDKLNTDITGPDGGVEVENLKGKKWRLAGDKTLAASPQTLEFGREAVAQSRANLKQAEGQKQIDLKKLADQVWAWVPRPTKDGQKQIDDATATLTDPANAASVKAWVAIVVEPQSFNAVQTELLKEGLIRPRTGAGATAVPMPPPPAAVTAAPPAGPPAPAPAPPAPAAPATVTVAVNDSLWKIAKAKLGAGASDVEIDAYSKRLYEANRALIGDDPDTIMPGIVLQLPPLGS
jgi:hypothetical protein